MKWGSTVYPTLWQLAAHEKDRAHCQNYVFLSVSWFFLLSPPKHEKVCKCNKFEWVNILSLKCHWVASQMPWYDWMRHIPTSLVFSCTALIVCHPTSPQLQRWLLFEPPHYLSLFPDHFLPNCIWFLALYTVYSSGLAFLHSCHSK